MFDRKIIKYRAKIVLSRAYFIILIGCFANNLIGGGLGGFWGNKVQNINFSNMSNTKILAVVSTAAGLLIIALAASVFIAGPLGIGLKKLVLKASEGDANLNWLLNPFRDNYKNAVIVTFMKSLVIFLWSLLAFVPLVLGMWKFNLIDKLLMLTDSVRAGSVPAAAEMVGLMTMWFVITVIFSVPAYIKTLQYYMVEYIAAENPDMSWRTALDKSKEMMYGNKWAMVKLLLSFAGWYVAAMFLCCVGPVLVMPYIEATVAQLYLELSGKADAYSKYGENRYNDPFAGF
ncbi:MAG: DUF975 family protein [Firmicutes bacterium]|nr:DUF975 family protein [Bacillota bacterium]